MKIIIIVNLLLILITGCTEKTNNSVDKTNALVVDCTSISSFGHTIEAIAHSLPKEKSLEFKDAITILVKRENKLTFSPNSNIFCNKNAEVIIGMAREGDPLYDEKCNAKKDLQAEVEKELTKIKISNVYLIERTRTKRHSIKVISIDVENKSKYTIASLYFSVILKSTERKIPWAKIKSAYVDIPGGLEVNEKKTLELHTNDLGDTSTYPSDALFELKITRILGANNTLIYNEDY